MLLLISYLLHSSFFLNQVYLYTAYFETIQGGGIYSVNKLPSLHRCYFIDLWIILSFVV